MTDEKSNPTDSSKLQSAEIIYPTPIQKASPLTDFAPEVRAYLSQNPEVAGQILITVLEGLRVDQDIKRQELTLVADRQRQEFDLRSKELDNKTKLETQRETRLTEESKSNKTTTRIVIGVVTFAFTAALGYGIVHKDSTLADKVFTGAMGLLGGAVGLAVLNQKKDQEADKK